MLLPHHTPSSNKSPPTPTGRDVWSVVGGRLQLPWISTVCQKTGPGPPGVQFDWGFTRVSIWGLQGLHSWNEHTDAGPKS